MKISNEKILTDIQRLRDLSNKQLPIKVSYALAKNISKIESELKIYDKERTKLIDKYALKDEKGIIKANEASQVIFKDDCREQWDKDIKELLAIENDVDIHKFKIDELNGYSMTPAELMLIYYMIEE